MNRLNLKCHGIWSTVTLSLLATVIGLTLSSMTPALGQQSKPESEQTGRELSPGADQLIADIAPDEIAALQSLTKLAPNNRTLLKIVNRLNQGVARND